MVMKILSNYTRLGANFPSRPPATRGVSIIDFHNILM